MSSLPEPVREWICPEVNPSAARETLALCAARSCLYLFCLNCLAGCPAFLPTGGQAEEFWGQVPKILLPVAACSRGRGSHQEGTGRFMGARKRNDFPPACRASLQKPPCPFGGGTFKGEIGGFQTRLEVWELGKRWD